ncbi:hypothetical protein A3K93_09425 [Acinetobacter sp. NCu2D-2]|uniref:hypothetical protein n=1 Tax=Acinetobacter sp. NCu2D-2 TaxID=1608473 RepID=UPI0007CDEFAE|nr:hypothetical protein [Acinetobacter sp. NCu2D-2]ANF82393.1 hypothetical protein A3K93_09425 [Acinetobacter sp. NCu2D-2]
MTTLEHAPEKSKVDRTAHFYSAWPMILALFGGAIGLTYGVLAYIINLKIYGSELTKLNKILANLMCGMTAISGWWFTAQWLQRMM